MANNFTALNYANTFGDWVNTTNSLSVELNALGKSIYTKDSGTLVLNGTGEVFRSNGNVNIYYASLQVAGVGSSAYIQNQLSVGDSLTVSGNTILQNNLSIYSNTITLSANSISGNNYITVYRGGTANSASLRWNESNQWWEVFDVNSLTYYKMLTSNTPSGVTAGFYGSTLQIPVLNIDTTGRIVGATTTGISTTVNLNGTTGSGIFNNGGSLSFAGSNGVTAVVSSSNTVTISTPQDLQITASPIHNNLTLANTLTTVNATVTNNVSATNATVTNNLSVATLNTSGFSYLNGITSAVTGYPGAVNAKNSGNVFLANITGGPATGFLSTTTASSGFDHFGAYSSGGTRIFGVDSAGSITGNVGTFTRFNMATGSWTTSSDGYNRLHFSASDSTYLSGVSGGWYIRMGDQSNSSKSIFTGNGDFYTVGNVTAYWSDRRLKKNLSKISDWRDIINGLNGYRYEWNDLGRKVLGDAGEEEDGIKVGLIAQEVQAVLPQAAAVQMGQYKDNKDGELIPRDDINYDPENPYLTVREEKLIPVLVEAVKGLMEEIEELRKEIKELKKA